MKMKHYSSSLPGTPVEIYLPDNKSSVTVNVVEGMTVDDALTVAAIKEGLSPVEHFVRIKKRKDMSTNKYFVPQRTDQLETYVRLILKGASNNGSIPVTCEKREESKFPFFFAPQKSGCQK